MKFSLLFSLLFLFSSLIQAQQITDSQMKAVLSTWQKKSEDSIKHFRNESDKLRSQMRDLVKQLNHDPMFILGPEESWIKEDMNLLFNGVPSGMKVHLERDPRQIQLENKHVALYWADLKVYRWKQVKKTVDSVASLTSPLKDWLFYENDPENKEKMSDKKAFEYLNQRIAGQLWSDYSKFFPDGNSLLAKKKTKQTKENPLDFIYSSDDMSKYLIESYPAQGQYNFYLHENLEYEGYAYFSSDSFNKKMEPYLSQDWNYSVIWKDNKKYQHIQPNLRINFLEDAGFKFKIPTDLKPSTFYQIQIIASIYDDATAKTKRVVLLDNYIRTSKYSLVDKILALKEQRPVYDREKGTFEVVIDEPFDVIERSGVNNKGKKLLKISSNTNTGQEADYYIRLNEINAYLNTPKVTIVDTMNLDNVPSAELDNTANLISIRNLNKAGIRRSYNEDNLRDTIKIGKAILLKEDFMEKDTILGAFFAPIVTKSDFNKGKIDMPKSFKYEISVPGLKKQYEVCSVLYKAILERAKERANYFYQLDLRTWKRNNSTEKPVFSNYLNAEMDNLLPSLRQVVAFSKSYPFVAQIQFQKNSRNDDRFLVWSIEILR